jgi:hypothetical protein
MNFIVNQVKNSFKKQEDTFRLFHGRGGRYADYTHLTVDWIDPIMYVKFFI